MSTHIFVQVSAKLSRVTLHCPTPTMPQGPFAFWLFNRWHCFPKYFTKFVTLFNFAAITSWFCRWHKSIYKQYTNKMECQSKKTSWQKLSRLIKQRFLVHHFNFLTDAQPYKNCFYKFKYKLNKLFPPVTEPVTHKSSKLWIPAVTTSLNTKKAL